MCQGLDPAVGINLPNVGFNSQLDLVPIYKVDILSSLKFDQTEAKTETSLS